MNVRIATSKELLSRGYIQTVTKGEIAYVRTLANGKQIGVRQSTMAELSGATWNWNEFEDQRDYHGIASRRFRTTAPGRWVLEEMVVKVAAAAEQAPSGRQPCQCTTRNLMIHGCRCGGI